jgi:GT2 family glycosyltransferase
MPMKFDLSVSIVVYKSNLETIEQTIASVYKTKLNFKLYVIDNSPTDALKVLKRDSKTEYIFCNKNLGFGKAHNIAMHKAIGESKYHLVLNPDIYFDKDVLETIFAFMEANKHVGQIMPKICYPDGEIQRLCKLLPAPADLFLRRFFPWFPGADERNKKYELRESGYNKIMNIPYLSGCFMFFRTAVLKEVGLFDERIFMYIEDTDITRRIHQKYQTLFFPSITVYHHYAKGSYKNFKLMLYNIHGAVMYFNKWGWLFDAERRNINKEVLEKYTEKS